LPDRFALLLPERRRAAPSVDHILVALHGRKYSSGRLTRYTYKGQSRVTRAGSPDRGHDRCQRATAVADTPVCSP
jgi:hypothetical protein